MTLLHSNPLSKSYEYLPLEKRYTWRVFSALKWALADFEDEYVGLDLPHIPRLSTMNKAGQTVG